MVINFKNEELVDQLIDQTKNEMCDEKNSLAFRTVCLDLSIALHKVKLLIMTGDTEKRT